MLNKFILFNMLTTFGFNIPDAQVMVCIAQHESAFNYKAINKDLNSDGSADYGLFQINDRLWADKCNLTIEELLTPEANIQCAKKVHSQLGFEGWVAYKKHKQTCDNYRLFKGE